MRYYGRRKKSRKKVTLEWEREDGVRYLRVIDSSGKPVAVIQLERSTVQGLLDTFDL